MEMSHQEDSRVSRLITSSVSNRKLHCTLVILILFILIFLSLPLLLIYLANTRYVEQQNRLASSGLTKSGELRNGSRWDNQNQPLQPVNCTDFALHANLSLADENVHCPTGTFPCDSCPEICIEQRRQCDNNSDCPDESDERSCHDGNGALMPIFKNIVNNSKRKQPITVGSNSSLAKPESCTQFQLENEQCPCVITDPQVVICEQLGFTSIPNNLRASVFKLRMSNNSISNIDHVVWPNSLQSLVLVNNSITHIGATAFQTAPNLSKLYISLNQIAQIDLDAFRGLSSLTSIWLESNRLTTFDSRMLRQTPAVTKIYLSENQIDLPEWTSFRECKNLRELLLDHNRISIIKAHWFSGMSSLIWLSLAHNQISAIEDGAFNWNYDLEELNLAFNRIHSINRQTFAERLNIQRLYLGGNPLNPPPADAFRELLQLRSLNLTDVEFDYINKGTFSYLTLLDFIYFSKFRYCHYANHVRVCKPHTDGLSSATELLAFPTLKYAVWIVASVCSLGNVFVFIWRSISPHEDRTLSLFVRNLSIADLMMGIYLGVIGWQDWKFQHGFGHFAIEWMSSATCTAIGFLAILSSELSVFILTIITIERYRCIMSINRFEEDAQKQRARAYVALAWLAALLIASYPLVERSLSKSDYYATNALCLPLHIDQPYIVGWQYSAFIYLGINFAAVMIIIVLYAHMYSIIIDGRQVTRPALFKAEKREDAILAVRFFFIVVTDCLCWIPIVVIKIMALANVNIHSSICGWLVVFIIPINSALNPIVYTLAAPTSLRTAVCKLFMRLCYKVDLFSSGGSSYSSHSSSASEPNLDPREINRRRKVTGSNSTTCETFEVSMASQSKGSVESALFASHLRKLSGPNQHLAAIDSGGGGAAADLGGGFYQHCYVTLAGTKTLRPYDLLSTCDHQGAIKEIILAEQTSASDQNEEILEDHSETDVEQDCDTIERLDSISWLGWERPCKSCTIQTLEAIDRRNSGESRLAILDQEPAQSEQQTSDRLSPVQRGDSSTRQRRVSFSSKDRRTCLLGKPIDT